MQLKKLLLFDDRNDALAWAEYAMHFATSSGKEIKDTNYKERLYNNKKVINLDRIEPIIREEKVFGTFNNIHPEKDAVVFVGKSHDGNRIEIITRLDKHGNIKADLTEITALVTRNKAKEIPPPRPLAEVVEAVAQHQAAGFSLSTDDTLSQTFKNSSNKNENSQNQRFSSASTSLNQVAAGLKAINFEPDTTNLDIGGGKFDEGTKYLAEKGVKNIVFDPFNRNETQNI